MENNEKIRVDPPIAIPRVALYVTCLADLMRPSVAQASLQLLEAAGCEVTVPAEQSCCGQPSYNNGDYPGAARVAKQLIQRFESFDYVVLPSGSCAGMLIKHYPRLLEGEWRERAEQFAKRVYELSTFLLTICDYQPAFRESAAHVVYHDGCAGLRELKIKEQPRALLARANVAVAELSQADVCCGFGGTFCAKMPGVSGDMADRKIEDAENTEENTLVAGDLGCLLALEGRAHRTGSQLRFRHIAEILLGEEEISSGAETSAPPRKD